MGSLDPAKMLVILVITLIVLGPERLPRVARQVGGMWRELTKVREQVISEIRNAIPDDLPGIKDLPRIPTPSVGTVSGFVSGLMTSTPPTTAAVTGPDDVIETQVPEGWNMPPPAIDASTPAETDKRSLVIVHPALGEFAFVPDDPDMN